MEVQIKAEGCMSSLAGINNIDPWCNCSYTGMREMYCPRKIDPKSLPKHSPTTSCFWIVRLEVIPQNCCHHGVAKKSRWDTSPWWNAETFIVGAALYSDQHTHMLRKHEQTSRKKLQRSTSNSFLSWNISAMLREIQSCDILA